MAHSIDIGMCFDRSFPGSQVTDFARRLDAGGVDELWLIEDCFYTTAPPLAAAALATTERISVGLGILPAVARTAAVTAMEIATLASIGPGRVIGGIGHGVQSWMAQMGVRPASPLTALDEVLTAVRRLLRGEEVSVDGRFVHLDRVRLEHVPDPVPPVLAGVRGPKSIALAGRAADGVVLAGFCPPEYVASSLSTAATGADFQVTCFSAMAIAPDARTAYAVMAPLVVEALEGAEGPGLQHLPFHDDLAELARTRGVDGVAGMPRDWWVRMGPIGTREDAAEHIALLAAAGATSVALFPAPDLKVAHGQVDDVIALAGMR
jgi:5,10-methylenetetrahydromethanopterin reductase